MGKVQEQQSDKDGGPGDTAHGRVWGCTSMGSDRVSEEGSAEPPLVLAQGPPAALALASCVPKSLLGSNKRGRDRPQAHGSCRGSGESTAGGRAPGEGLMSTPPPAPLQPPAPPSSSKALLIETEGPSLLGLRGSFPTPHPPSPALPAWPTPALVTAFLQPSLSRAPASCWLKITATDSLFKKT